jgi:hypothetical protein
MAAVMVAATRFMAVEDMGTMADTTDITEDTMVTMATGIMDITAGGIHGGSVSVGFIRGTRIRVIGIPTMGILMGDTTATITAIITAARVTEMVMLPVQE